MTALTPLIRPTKTLLRSAKDTTFMVGGVACLPIDSKWEAPNAALGTSSIVAIEMTFGTTIIDTSFKLPEHEECRSVAGAGSPMPTPVSLMDARTAYIGLSKLRMTK